MAEDYQKIGDSTLLRTWGNNPPVDNVLEPPSSLFESGWTGGQTPPCEWMNYVDQQLGEKINHILQNGGSKWNATTEYLVGNVALHSNSVWLCLVNNTNSAPTDINTNWNKILTLATLPAYPTLNSLLPSQAGNSGKVLKTNGTNATWELAPFATVNFDGTASADVSGTYTRTGTLVTASITGHGHVSGHRIYVDFTSGGALDGWYTVDSVVDANTFTFNTVASGSITTHNLTLTRRSIRKSLNVQSVVYGSVTGDYAVNFITFAPDANYNITGSLSTPASAPCVLNAHWSQGIGGVQTPTTGYFHIYSDRPSFGGTNVLYNHIVIFA